MGDTQAPIAERLLVSALELDPAERDAYLDRECGADPELRRQVERLLQAAESADDYFLNLAGRLGVERLRREPAGYKARAGQTFGPYRLTERVGSGGMGAVWRAERADGRFVGDVAVKLLTRSTSSTALAQFDREAHYLAKLTHPNIARLLDAGVGDDDVPFLILEYVDGVAIDRYCDRQRLTVDGRLRLLTTVVDAVAHAHSQLVVHNDIKPSNVLVTADGTVKLLDFGIATLLHDDAAGAVVGLTPEFAAPEQLSRAGATTATDIYALGLLLHVLVAGRVPRRLSETDSLKRLRQEVSREVPGLAETLDHPDSGTDPAAVARLRRTSVTRLARLLRGELSAVARKALAVRPDRRYASAVEFGADLRRYRRSEPVSVLPDTLRYRTRKFAERHRGGVLSAILTVIVLLGAVAVTTYQSIEANRQRDAALFEQQRTHASYEFVTMLLSEVGPGGKPISVEELLDRGVEMIDRQYGAEDRFVAYTLYSISQMYASLGQIDSQLEVLARAERIARDVGDERVLAALLCARSRVKHVADPAAAAADLAEGLRVGARAGEGFIMECARAEGLALSTEGRHEQAMAVFEEALQVSTDRVLEFPAQRAVLLNDLAEQYLLTDRPATALEMLDEVITIREEIGQGQTISHLIMLVNRGTILDRLGELAPAIESIGRAYEHVQAMPNPLIGIGVHYAGRLSEIGRYDEALAVIEPEHARALAADNQRWAAQAAMILGLTHARLGDADAAAPYLDSAEAFFNKTPTAHQHQLARVWVARTRLQLDAGDIEAARASVATTLRMLGYPSERHARGMPEALLVAAGAERLGGDAALAHRYASDALAISAGVARDPARSAYVGRALHERALASLALSREAEALADLRKAATALSNGLGANHGETKTVKRLLREYTADAT